MLSLFPVIVSHYLAISSLSLTMYNLLWIFCFVQKRFTQTMAHAKQPAITRMKGALTIFSKGK